MNKIITADSEDNLQRKVSMLKITVKKFWMERSLEK